MKNNCQQCLKNSQFLIGNPFVNISVGEADIWGDSPWAEFHDLPAINSATFATMVHDIENVRAIPGKPTRLRFVLGGTGSGKSHLFARLRRHCAGKGRYCLVLNPPSNEDMVVPHLLRNVIRSLRHPVVSPGGMEMRYSQLQLLVYEMIRQHTDYTIEYIDELWRTKINNPRIIDAQAQRNEIISQVTPKFAGTFNVELHLIRALLSVPMESIGYLAIEWLSGSNKLTDEDLSAINQKVYLDEGGAQELLYFLGRLSASFDSPIVLVLDQLDALVSEEPIRKYEQFLMGLKDQSSNWAVFVSLIEDKYQRWAGTLGSAFTQRFSKAVMDGTGSLFELATANINPIGKSDREGLVRDRLRCLPLKETRKSQGCANDICPLEERDIDDLAADNNLLYPRQVLSKAYERYIQRVNGSPITSPGLLPDMLEAELSDLIASVRAQYPRPEEIATDEIWARAIEVMKVTLGSEDALKVEKGPLHKDRNFKGIDTLITLGGGARLRLVCHDIPTTAFLNLLKKLNGSPDKILLLRNGRVKTSGKKTQEQLGEFTGKGNTFLHLKDDEMYAMLALGKLLAKAREGNYAHLITEPACTYDNILGTLAQVEQLEGHRIAGYIKDLVHPAPPPTTQTKIPPPPSPPPPPIKPPSDISSIMRRERWLALERLRLLLKRANVQMSSHALLESARAVSDISIHRISEKDPEFVILVWQGEA